MIDEPRIHEYGDGGNIHKKVSLEFETWTKVSPRRTSSGRTLSSTKATRICHGTARCGCLLRSGQQADALERDTDSALRSSPSQGFGNTGQSYRVIATPNGAALAARAILSITKS